ncbi:hypothetical protein IX318_000096 [Porphyromonas levii]|nr:hypothetical protein [Porphyromonas levii]MBR8714261.1 hypothetical protein [Porphyromonas levii]MBR8726803.1 hypothetical protein [Porphyromonas levii]MBR8735109.1 hypothetical protein [Porphyromonas levii]MBR8766554.1 hypothetical protein [Porphyromonas levii]
MSKKLSGTNLLENCIVCHDTPLLGENKLYGDLCFVIYNYSLFVLNPIVRD